MNSQIISIITPSLNRANLIVEAIESVLSQDYPVFEHIIVDGGSTDGTLDILAKYPHLKVVSAPDKGMYDAINKGMELARGDIIGFLNTDDLYEANIFSEIVKKFQQDEFILAVAGGATVFIETTEGTQNSIAEFFPKTTNVLELSTIGIPFFNAWFFHKSVFGLIGNFNIHYPISADREFMLRFALNQLAYTTLDMHVYRYREHAGSMTFDANDRKLEKRLNEHIEMTDFYLQKPDLSQPARDLIRKSRTKDTVELFLCAIRQYNLRKMHFYMACGVQYDFAWIFWLVKRFIDGLLRRVKKTPRQRY